MACESHWSNLPPDVLRVVWALLPMQSRVGARAVCAAWASAMAPGTAAPFPWLLRPPPAATSSGGDASSSSSSSTVLLPFTGSTATTQCVMNPFLRPGARCVGMQDGWIAAVDADLGVKILNPVTGAHVDLPPLTSSAIQRRWSPRLIAFKIAFSTPGAVEVAGEDGVETVAYFSGDLLLYTTAGLDTWSRLDPLYQRESVPTDYGINRTLRTAIVDIAAGSHGGGGCWFFALTEPY